MTDMMSLVDDTENPQPAAVTLDLDGLDEQLIGQLLDRAKTGGLRLTGEGGVLQQLTKRLLESALDGEITDHLGDDKHDSAGRNTGNSRNGTRVKTVLTDVGPVEITVPRDRDGSFEPKIVAKRQKRPTGVDEMVISLAAKGLTTGEISAHVAEVYGAQVSRQTISTITDKVIEGMIEWQNRPLSGLRRAWEAEHGSGSVIGLAPSAAAADVLASESWDRDGEHRQAALRARPLPRPRLACRPRWR